MTEKIGSTLPKYESPPLIEVVCGVIFKSIDGLLAPHLGQLWDLFKPDYARCREVPRLDPEIEGFGTTREVKVQITPIPPLPRIWFVTAGDDRIVQIQRDRLHHNWKKGKPEDKYPHYKRISEMFQEALRKFKTFLADQQLGGIEPLQFEMTYVNQIPKGDGWGHISEIGKLFPDIAWRKREQRFLKEPEDFSWQTAFKLPDKAGRLRAAVSHVLRQEDNRPVFQLDLTARGIGTDKSALGMLSWFDVAHSWIVRAFEDLTDETIQNEVWKKIKS